MSVHKEVGRPTNDSKKRDESFGKVTKTFMEQYTPHSHKPEEKAEEVLEEGEEEEESDRFVE